MSKRINTEIGKRAAAEIRRRAVEEDTTYSAQEVRVGLYPGSICRWESGIAPAAMQLAALHSAGYDVGYILTGERRQT